MKQLIQLFKLIFLKEFHNSTEHYAQGEIVKFYTDMIDKGLFPDELEAFRSMQENGVRSLILIGAGTGREAKVFAENGLNVYAIEPVNSMKINAYKHPKISYFEQLNEVNASEDVIYITRNLLSLLNRKEREFLLSQIFMRMDSKKLLLFQADIMTLSWNKSFKLKFLEQVGRFFNLNRSFESGDTYRFNLDYNAQNNIWCFYHYFPESADLLYEVKSHCRNCKIKELSGGFFCLQLVDE